jgi:hypothetical protein
VKDVLLKINEKKEEEKVEKVGEKTVEKENIDDKPMKFLMDGFIID